MIRRSADPRTEDRISYELLRTPPGGSEPEVVGRATFRGGRTTVDGPEEVAVAVRELLERGFVDRVQADERPRGYRRSGRGIVDLLVPGMAEHFIARMRGLWLSYPDGSVVTAREALPDRQQAAALLPDLTDAGPPVVDPQVRRGTLAEADDRLGRRLVAGHPPEPGVRHAVTGDAPRRTDCGWLV